MFGFFSGVGGEGWRVVGILCNASEDEISPMELFRSLIGRENVSQSEKGKGGFTRAIF